MKRRGFMFIDAVVALGLLAAVAAVLITAKAAAGRAARAGDDRRAAVRQAEAYLAGDRTAAPPPAVTPLPTTAPAGYQWVGVRAEVNGHAGELVGLVKGAAR